MLWENSRQIFSRTILFWFCKETVQPIVTFELGRWLRTQKPIFVGVHPEYQRRLDVELQTAEGRPSISIVYTLEDLAQQVIKWFEPVDLNVPMAELPGWSKETEGQLIYRGLMDGPKTVSDWLEFFNSGQYLKYQRSGLVNDDLLEEVSRRLCDLRLV